MKCFVFTLCSVFVLGLFSPSLFAQKSLDQWYQNKEFGFKLRTISKWKQIPLQPDETIAVTKFNGPDIEIIFGQGRTATGNPELLILRFVPKHVEVTTGGTELKEPPTEKPDAEEAMKKKIRELQEAQTPRNFEQWLKKGSGFGGIKSVSKKEAKYGKLNAIEHVFTHKGRVCDFTGFAVEFPLEGQTIVVLYDIAQPQYEKFESIFRQSTKTFALIEKDKKLSEDVTAKTLGDDESLDEQRKRQQKDVAKTPGWTLAETKNYFIKIHNPDEDFISQVKEHIELIRARLEADFPPIKPITTKSVLRVCKDRDEYINYGGPGGSAGYWSSGTEELVIYDSKDVQRSDSFRTMYHEAFHQYIYYRCGELAPHSWYNEGTGDYYAGAVYKYGKFEIRPFLWRTDIIREAVHSGRHIALEKFTRWSQSEYYAQASLAYAQGWSLIYFLREGKRLGAKNWKKDWDRILPTYLDVMTESRDKDKAVIAAFDGIDLVELEKAWLEFTKGV